MVTLNSTVGDLELPADVTGVSADTTEALLVSGIQNMDININDGSSSNIAADDDFNSTPQYLFLG